MIKMIETFFNPVTLDQARSLYIDALTGVRSAGTVYFYGAVLKYLNMHFLPDTHLTDIKLNELRLWRTKLYEKDMIGNPPHPGHLSEWTIHDILKSTRIFFNWCVREGYLKENPTARLEMPHRPDPTRTGIPEESMRKMIEVAKCSHARDLALILFVRDTGCRRGGASSVTLSDLNLKSKDVRLRRVVKIREKGEKERSVFLQRRSAKALRMWLEVRGQYAKSDVKNVFVAINGGYRGKALTPNGITIIFHRLAKQAGVTEKFSPHQWRHSFARRLIYGGANLAQVQQVLGHSSSVTTTRFYASLTTHQLQEAVDRYLPKDDPDFEYDEEV